ncbi:MAG: hypothetical protein Q7U64_13925 [Desulfocapsaceae bacterium]|nr:hypothetical protein [Desulfocapsaceae bacterium]
MPLPDHPADESITNGLKIISYGVNSKGEYELTLDDVWQPVNVVNTQAWQEIDKNIAASKDRIAAGRVSCLHYYMTANQMDTGLLAQYTGQARWKVCLHLVPFFFKRLSADTLKKYAELYQISPDDLTQGRLQPPLYNLK